MTLIVGSRDHGSARVNIDHFAVSPDAGIFLIRLVGTMLINHATGTAGRLAVQLALYLGASEVIATGRNEEELEDAKALGAGVVIPFTLGALHPFGATQYEQAPIQEFACGDLAGINA